MLEKAIENVLDADPANEVEQSIKMLEPLVKSLVLCSTLFEKIAHLNENSLVKNFMRHAHSVHSFFQAHNPECELVIKSIVAMGQSSTVFHFDDQNSEAPSEIYREDIQVGLCELLRSLIEVERFYAYMGGLAGYHLAILQAIAQQNQSKVSSQTSQNLQVNSPPNCQSDEQYRHPDGVDIAKETSEIKRMLVQGLKCLPSMAEIYPVGGAGDRLSLCDETTGEPLPAACLPFCGRSLLSGLIRDLQGREYVYYKLYGRRLTTPIAMMTSAEKDNHRHILEICEQEKWYGRSKESFCFFKQILVPVIAKNGQWLMKEPLSLSLKPGGHGVMWKLASDMGIFAWLASLGRSKAIVRQINNPVAGLDYSLLAFAGIGCTGFKAFGFASCPRLVLAAEGMLVLNEKKRAERFVYSIRNIEYTDFASKGLKDLPAEAGSPFSSFPANTNILFVDLPTIQQVIKTCPIPGLLVNMKSKVSIADKQEGSKEIEAGRLESTMQNISDYIVDEFPRPLVSGHSESSAGAHAHSVLRTFVTYNERRKTISTTKNSCRGNNLTETPEGAFYDLLYNMRDLLVNKCQMDLPELNPPEAYLQNGPSFIALLHPALGPLYGVIAQKIRGGVLTEGSEMQLEIAELFMDNVRIRGSLLVYADYPMGLHDEQGVLQYSSIAGKCSLINVEVSNKGMARKSGQRYWRNGFPRQEALTIHLRGSGEFHAENVSLTGGLTIEVPDGERVTARNEGGQIVFRTEKITTPTWFWKYTLDKGQDIVLKMEGL